MAWKVVGLWQNFPDLETGGKYGLKIIAFKIRDRKPKFGRKLLKIRDQIWVGRKPTTWEIGDRISFSVSIWDRKRILVSIRDPAHGSK